MNEQEYIQHKLNTKELEQATEEAARRGFPNAVKFFLEKGAGTGDHTSEGALDNVVRAAARSGSGESIRHVLAIRRDKVTQEGLERAQADAMKHGHPNAARIIADHVANNDVPTGPFDIDKVVHNSVQGFFNSMSNAYDKITGSQVPHNDALAKAALKGDVAGMQKALDNGADIHSGRSGPSLALLNAIDSGVPEAVQLAIDKGARPDLGTGWGNSIASTVALTKAVMNGNVEAVKILTDKKIGLDNGGNYGRSDLNALIKHAAGMSGERADDLTKLLLEREALEKGEQVKLLKPGQTVSMDSTFNALEKAAAYGTVDTLKVVLEHGGEKLSQGPYRLLLDRALTSVMGRHDIGDGMAGHMERMKLLTDAGAKIEGDAVIQIAKADQPELLKLLLEKGGDGISPDDLGSALSTAAVKGHGENVEVILGAGAGKIPQTHLDRATNAAAGLSGDRAMTERLIAAGGDPNAAMEGAAVDGRRDMVDFALQKGASNFNMGLIGAAQGGHLAIVDFFLEKGADDLNGAVEKATWEKHADVTERLLDAGADPNVALLKAYIDAGMTQLVLDKGGDRITQDTLDQTLLTAVGSNQVAVVETLFKSRDSFDEQTLDKALNIAAEKGLEGMTQLVIDKGDNRITQDAFNQALHTAVGENNQDVVKVLLKNNDSFDEQTLDKALNVAVEKGFENMAGMIEKYKAGAFQATPAAAKAGHDLEEQQIAPPSAAPGPG